MNPFVIVNEVAILSTACLMVAISTVWYAPAFFGNENKETGPHGDVMVALVRFFGYGIAVFVLAYFSAYIEVLELTLWQIGLLLCGLLVPLVGMAGYTARKSLRILVADIVFLTVFVFVSLYVITFWPW